MITARHCVGNGDVENLSVAFNYQISTDLDIQEVEYKVAEAIDLGGKYSLDYAVIRIEGKPGIEHGYLDFAYGDQEDGDPIVIIQHPNGEAMQVDYGNVKTQIAFG